MAEKAQTIEGVVAAYGEPEGFKKGSVKLEGSDTWYRRTKDDAAFEGGPWPPNIQRGQKVRLHYKPWKSPSGEVVPFVSKVETLTAPEQPHPAPQQATNGKAQPGDYAFRDTSIARQVALKAAVDVALAMVAPLGESGKPLVTPSTITNMATYFADWILDQDSEPEQSQYDEEEGFEGLVEP